MSDPKTMRMADWPAEDRALWDAAVRPGGLFDEGGNAADWSARSQATISWEYGRWLRFMESTGMLKVSPAGRVTPHNVDVYIDSLRGEVCSTTVWNYVKHLYDAIRVMAPESFWAWLREVVTRLEINMTPGTNKAARIRDSEVLFSLGIELMDAALTAAMNADDRTRLCATIDYRDGLMIALLAARPIRRRNLTMIRIGRQLVRMGSHWMLVFAAEETKNHRSLEFPVPETLVPYIDEYIERVRGVIPGAARHDGLWPSREGAPLTYSGIYDRVVLRTCQAFGTPIPPHLFRDCAASSLARRDPAHVGAAAQLLGHADHRTTEKFYIQADQQQAVSRHQHTMQNLKECLAAGGLGT